MFGVTININPTDSTDLQNALNYILDQPCMKEYRETYMQRQGNDDAETQKMKDEIQGLKSEVEYHILENEKYMKTIKEQEKKISELEQEHKQELDELQKKYNELEKDYMNSQSVMKENEENWKKEIEELKRRIADKEQESNQMRKSLEGYSVSLDLNDSSEKRFFEVKDNGVLEESVIPNTSLFCASKSEGGLKYSINVENNLTMRAISNVDYYLKPFCDIQMQMEGANTIQIVSVGKARLVGAHFQILEKAVVSLIKQ